MRRGAVQAALRGAPPACLCPLPAPRSSRRPSTNEALVVAHHQLRLDLLHRLDHDRDHDKQRRSAERESAHYTSLEQCREDGGRDGDQGQEDGPGEGQPEDDLLQVVAGGRARSYAGYEATVLA